ncbi:hypothetical protein VP01_801g15 [Puccinia sorghi]|uniref:MMS19 nucleotide excision repair protein n=1 Tax=Puccinia sorghi TaxID=27349 RepID=A0A0L6UBB2_9BASI|nr:hypothetical protein VP01_801g15 [Puccinia sorghi]
MYPQAQCLPTVENQEVIWEHLEHIDTLSVGQLPFELAEELGKPYLPGENPFPLGHLQTNSWQNLSPSWSNPNCPQNINLADGPPILVQALAALQSLSKSDVFQAEHAIKSCQVLFQHVTIRDLEQPKRFSVLMLLDSLLAYHRDALKSMGAHFLFGYCYLVKGEKDPRNLVVAFKLAKVILIKFDLGDQAESFFDITFCYFPITFRPPPGNLDAYGGIIAKELTQGSIDCLSATPQFGILVLPLLLEKIQAPGVAPQIFQPNTSPSPDFLRLLEHGCHTLFSIVFPSEVQSSPSGPLDFMKQALEVVMKELHSPEKSRAIPATQLFGWIIKSGASVTDAHFYISGRGPPLEPGRMFC